MSQPDTTTPAGGDATPPVWEPDGLEVRASRYALRPALLLPVSGAALLLVGEPPAVLVGLAFLAAGAALLLVVRRSRCTVSPDGRLRLVWLRARPEVGLAHARAITRRRGLLRLAVAGDPAAGSVTLTVPLHWWEHEETVAQVLRDTARISGCRLDPAAALVLGIPARRPGGAPDRARMPLPQALALLALVAATGVWVVAQLAGAVVAARTATPLALPGGLDAAVAIRPQAWARVLAAVVPLAAGAGAVLAWLWRRVDRARTRRRLQWAGTLLLLVVPLSAPAAWNASTALVLHQRAVLAAWLLALAAVTGYALVAQALSGRAGRRQGPPGASWSLALALVLAAAPGALIGANYLGDLLGPAHRVTGTVERVAPSGDTALVRPALAVTVAGEEFRAVGEVRAHVWPGVRLEARALQRTRTLRDVRIAPAERDPANEAGAQEPATVSP